MKYILSATLACCICVGLLLATNSWWSFLVSIPLALVIGAVVILGLSAV